MGFGLPGSLPSYILYYLLCIFLLWLIKLLLLLFVEIVVNSSDTRRSSPTGCLLYLFNVTNSEHTDCGGDIQDA